MSKVTLAGVTLYQPTPDVKDDIERRLRPQLARVFETSAWAGPQGYGRDRWSPVSHDPNHPFEVGSLFWPTGAARFAFGHFLTHAGDLDTITSQGIVDGVPLPLPLKIGDEVETLVYLLPSFPLYTSEDCQVRILTVVDERYFWWFRKNDIAIDVGTTTWATLLSDINSALLTTITSDSVASAYLKPGAALTSRQEYLPLLIDAVAYNTGLRFVRDLDGNNKLMSYDTSAALEATNVTKTKWMGGQMRLGTGGEERALVLPEKVVVRFPRSCHTFYYVEKTLVSLGLSGMSGVVGFTGAKHFHDQLVALGPGTPTNDAELQALVAQVATDWYKHQLGQEFVSYREIVDVAPHGLMDSITWRANGDECSTTVYRPELNDLAEELVHGGRLSPCPGASSGGRTNRVVRQTRVHNTTVKKVSNVTRTTATNIHKKVFPQTKRHNQVQIRKTASTGGDPKPSGRDCSFTFVTDLCRDPECGLYMKTRTVTITKGVVTDCGTETPLTKVDECVITSNVACADCDMDDAPETIICKFSNGSGDWECLNDLEVPIYYDSGLNHWFSGYDVSSGCDNCEIQVILQCPLTPDASWSLDIALLKHGDLPCDGAVEESITASCDPFMLHFEFNLSGSSDCDCLSSPSGSGSFDVDLSADTSNDDCACCSDPAKEDNQVTDETYSSE